ncbi:unnamed protein product [Owenia fusiformis]|uniref:Uncharacterized protein n=1 Tax=Owenia fusiformis TaxID=6347 RepID=A0A8S4P3W5_OWEFU|nr:unnamed protein product [Owenia fusiformis]
MMEQPAGRIINSHCILSHDQWIEHCTFSHSKRQIATCSYNTVTIWDLNSNDKVAQLTHNECIWKAQFSKHDSTIYCTSSEGNLYIWKWKTMKLISKNKIHSGCAFGCAIHPTKNVIATCGFDTLVKVINMKYKTLKIKNTLQGHRNAVEHLEFSPCGDIIASCSKDKTIRLWQNYLKNNSHKILKNHSKWVLYCKFSSTGSFLVSCGSDRMVIVWDVETGTIIEWLCGHSNIVWGCAFFKMNNRELVVSCSSDRSVRIWEPKFGHEIYAIKEVGAIKDGTGQLYAIDVNSSENTIAVGSHNGSLHILTIDSNNVLFKTENFS